MPVLYLKLKRQEPMIPVKTIMCLLKKNLTTTTLVVSPLDLQPKLINHISISILNYRWMSSGWVLWYIPATTYDEPLPQHTFCSPVYHRHVDIKHFVKTLSNPPYRIPEINYSSRSSRSRGRRSRWVGLSLDADLWLMKETGWTWGKGALDYRMESKVTPYSI